MSASDWVSIAQAVLLAVAGYFGWRAYSLAVQEHRENRAEQKRGPKRRLLMEAIEELKTLATVAKAEKGGQGDPGWAKMRHVRAQMLRLEVAIAFVPWAELRDCRRLTTGVHPLKIPPDAIKDAAAELNWDLRALELATSMRVTSRTEPAKAVTFRHSRCSASPILLGGEMRNFNGGAIRSCGGHAVTARPVAA